MNKDNLISIGVVILLAIGVVLFGTLFYKVIVAILHSSIHLVGCIITTIEILTTFFGFCAGFIIIVLLLAAVIWSIKKLGEQMSNYFTDLATKVDHLLNKKPERIYPHLLP